jgi:hypothetical protein
MIPYHGKIGVKKEDPMPGTGPSTYLTKTLYDGHIDRSSADRW